MTLLNEVDSYDTRLNEKAVGVQVREYLVKMQNLFSRINEIHDQSLRDYESLKLILEETEEVVDETLIKAYPISRGRKKYKLNVKVKVEDKEVTLLDIKKELIISEFLLLRAKSKLNEIKSAISTARSVLAWDRHEYSET